MRDNVQITRHIRPISYLKQSILYLYIAEMNCSVLERNMNVCKDDSCSEISDCDSDGSEFDIPSFVYQDLLKTVHAHESIPLKSPITLEAECLAVTKDAPDVDKHVNIDVSVQEICDQCSDKDSTEVAVSQTILMRDLAMSDSDCEDKTHAASVSGDNVEEPSHTTPVSEDGAIDLYGDFGVADDLTRELMSGIVDKPLKTPIDQASKKKCSDKKPRKRKCNIERHMKVKKVKHVEGRSRKSSKLSKKTKSHRKNHDKHISDVPVEATSDDECSVYVPTTGIDDQYADYVKAYRHGTNLSSRPTPTRDEDPYAHLSPAPHPPKAPCPELVPVCRTSVLDTHYETFGCSSTYPPAYATGAYEHDRYYTRGHSSYTEEAEVNETQTYECGVASPSDTRVYDKTSRRDTPVYDIICRRDTPVYDDRTSRCDTPVYDRTLADILYGFLQAHAHLAKDHPYRVYRMPREIDRSYIFNHSDNFGKGTQEEIMSKYLSVDHFIRWLQRQSYTRFYCTE